MEQFRLWGAIVNAALVVAGSALGLLFKRLIGDASKNERAKTLSDHIFHGMALCVLAIGVSGAIESSPILIVIISMALGSLLGHLMRLDAGVNFIGNKIEALAKDRFGNVAQGFVSASLLFCVGSMAIVGALEGGLVGDHSLLYAKTVLDTVFAVVFAYSMGIGVALSAVLILLYQGSIALLAQWVAPLLTADVIMTMSVVGSVLIFGLGLKLLGLLKIKVLNHVPAVFVPIALVPLFELMGM